MLRNPKLLQILAPPDDPAGGPLREDGDQLIGAGWPVPIVNGVPDFVRHAPHIRKMVEYEVPVNDHPPPGVLRARPRAPRVPAWFRESPLKYGPLQDRAKGFLLDAGAGCGNRRTFMQLGYTYVGLDIDPAGRHSELQAGGEPDLDIVADCHRLPIRSGSVQVVNSTAVFEHLYNPALAAREIARVLAPGGLLLGSCSFLEGEHFDSQCHLTALGIYRLLTGAGLRVLAIYPHKSLWEMHSGSIYFSLPFNKLLGRIHERLYLALVKIKSREAVLSRRFRLSAILEFQAAKEDGSPAG